MGFPSSNLLEIVNTSIETDLVQGNPFFDLGLLEYSAGTVLGLGCIPNSNVCGNVTIDLSDILTLEPTKISSNTVTVPSAIVPVKPAKPISLYSSINL